MPDISPQLKWNRANPEAIAAHRIVDRAIRHGQLVRQPCQICGAPAEAHHPDYREPLHVEWLCRFHHRRLHAKGEGDLFAENAI
jgi:hypothetical protein